MVSGTPPPGLLLSANGGIAGTATTAGDYPFTLQVADSGQPQQSTTSAFSITILPKPTPPLPPPPAPDPTPTPDPTPAPTADPGSSSIVSLPIQNAGFEQDTIADGMFTYGVPGWTVNGRAGVQNPTADVFSPDIPQGKNTAFLDYGSLEQLLPSTFDPGASYELSFKVGVRPGYGASTFKLQMLAGTARVTNLGVFIPPTIVADSGAISSPPRRHFCTPKTYLSSACGFARWPGHHHPDHMAFWKSDQRG
jgi:hypothetical protein